MSRKFIEITLRVNYRFRSAVDSNTKSKLYSPKRSSLVIRIEWLRTTWTKVGGLLCDNNHKQWLHFCHTTIRRNIIYFWAPSQNLTIVNSWCVKTNKPLNWLREGQAMQLHSAVLKFPKWLLCNCGRGVKAQWAKRIKFAQNKSNKKW